MDFLFGLFLCVFLVHGEVNYKLKTKLFYLEFTSDNYCKRNVFNQLGY